MKDESTVLVLGARGRLGLAAARAFAAAGWRVLAQVRPGASMQAVPGIEWLALDPHDTAALARAAAGASVVVHGLSPAYTHRAWRQHLPGLTDAAIGVTRALGATLMLPGSVYNFGAAMPEVLAEDTPQQPTTFKGRMRLDSELRVRDAVRQGGLRAVVIRAGDFFGAGRGSWLDLVMLKDIRRGRFSHPADRQTRTAWAYLPELARTFVRVAEHRDRLPGFAVFHFTGHTVCATDWLAALQPIAREQGWVAAADPLQHKQVPWTMLRLVAPFVPTLAAICEMRYLWQRPYSLDNARLQALIGEEPHTPFPAAVRAALEDLQLLETASAEAALAH